MTNLAQNLGADSHLNLSQLSSSFRDPSGFLFQYHNELYRWVDTRYAKDFDLLKSSGLLDELHTKKLLIPHLEVTLPVTAEQVPYKILKPETIPFISYPHEWCFSQLKDAALLTLDIAERALKRGMMLKDATAYNVQFYQGRPVFIDTLSFEKYEEGAPWVAYKQFCQHFLAPLALMSYTDISLAKLFQIYIDGVPLPVASSILPLRTYLSFGLFLHIHAHAKTQKRYSESSAEVGKKLQAKMSKTALLGLFDGLRSAIKALNWKPAGTEWADYYSSTNYSDEAMSRKAALVRALVQKTHAKSVWDLGANTGVFSRIAAESGAYTLSCDIDPAAVERNYLDIRKKEIPNILPLIMDLTNPSTNFGWAGQERDSLDARGAADVALALALIHHISISNNVPFAKVAEYFSRLCKTLIIEFVPKSDSQVKKLLLTRKDIFNEYEQSDFEREFSKFFEIEEKHPIEHSERTLYLMRVR